MGGCHHSFVGKMGGIVFQLIFSTEQKVFNRIIMSDKILWKARELEILRLLAEGLTNLEIGARIHIAHETVRWYNKQIFGKLQVNNRTQAVRRATELGLLGGAVRSASSDTTSAPAKSPVQYTVNGDVHIAYQVIGDGPVDLLFIHGFLSHLELAWENSEFTNFFEQLGKFARVILFDKRGVGLSDRIQGAPTLENTIEDAHCVLDAVASKRTFVMGTSEGAAAAVLLASTYPKRIMGLILYGATPKVLKKHNEPTWATSEDQFEFMIEKMQREWGGPWAIESFAPSRAKDETFRAWWSMVLRSASSPSSIKAVLKLIGEVDICQILPQVRVKTLIIHKTNDQMVNVEAGRYFAEHMPNAQWLELSGDDHIYFVKSKALISAISRFLQDIPDTEPVDTWISTILCAHLSLDILNLFELQSEIQSHRARYTDFKNQNLLATFDSPTRAIQCALSLRNMIKDEKLKISLHVGECYTADGKPTEYVAEISRKAVELATNGEILLTQTLHDILAGSKLVFKSQHTYPKMRLLESMSLYTLI